VHFPVGKRVECAVAQSQFWDELRKSGPEDVTDIWDQPQGLHPAHGFVQAGDITVCGKEFSQYEVSDSENSEICFTLLLSTGVFRDGGNILTRKKSWSNPIPTPGAQCHGKHVYHYSVFPSATPEARKKLEHFQLAPLVHAAPAANGTRMDAHSLLEIAGDSQIQFSSLKQAETENMQILRLFNPNEEAQSDILRLNPEWTHFQYLNLDETPLTERRIIPSEELQLKIQPGEIITVGLMKISATES
jgi:alpha-mannosidase